MSAGSILLLAACSFSNPNHLRKDLANSGPLMLSRDNPYLAANMFLANEMSASPLLKGFIKHRGNPDALEISRHWFSPFRIHLYYLGNKQAYTLEETGEGWIVRGPERIPEKILSKFSEVQDFEANNPPPFKEEALKLTDEDANKGNPIKSESAVVPAQVSPASAEPADPSAADSKPTEQKESESKTPDKKDEFLELRRERLSQKQQQEATPSAPLGKEFDPTKKKANLYPPAAKDKKIDNSFPNDIIHQVSYPHETLRTIAAWYTETARNAGRIGRINGIENPDNLKQGQEIRIPGYLLKRIDPMPESQIHKSSKEGE